MFTRRFIASVSGTTLTAAALGLAALGFAGTAGGLFTRHRHFDGSSTRASADVGVPGAAQGPVRRSGPCRET